MAIRKFCNPLLVLNISTIFVSLKAIGGGGDGRMGNITKAITVLIYCDLRYG